MHRLRRTLHQLTNLALAVFLLALAGPALDHFDSAHAALVALRLVGG